MLRRRLRRQVTRKTPILQITSLQADQFPHRETDLKMNVRRFFIAGLLLAAASIPYAFSEVMQQQSNPASQASTPAPVPTGTQTATLPAQSQQTQGSAPLRVMVGKSLLINTTERLKTYLGHRSGDRFRPGRYPDADSGPWQNSGRDFAC